MSKKRTTMYFSPELEKALKLHGAIAGRTITSMVEEAVWAWLEDKGGKPMQDARIARLVEAAGLQ